MTHKRQFIFMLLCALVFLTGCYCQAPSGNKSEETAVSINKCIITRADFEQEFKDSALGKTDTNESRNAFLSSLIDRKLILQYAQKEDLDKERGFLKMIEKFWEQSLLKIALDKKMKEIREMASVKDDMVKKAYDEMLKEGKSVEPYDKAYSRLKWELTKAREAKLMDDWMRTMRKKAEIAVNKDIFRKN